MPELTPRYAPRVSRCARRRSRSSTSRVLLMAMPALTGARENRPAGIEGEVQPQADGRGPGPADSRRAVVIKTERADGVEGGGVAGPDSLDLPAGRLRGVPRGEEAQVPVECNLRPLVDVLRLGRHEMHFRQPRKLLLVLAGGLPQGLAGDVERILRGDELGSREVEPRLGLFDVGDRISPTSNRCRLCASCCSNASRVARAKPSSSSASSTPKYRSATRTTRSWRAAA